MENLNIKYISLNMLVALTGTPILGAAASTPNPITLAHAERSVQTLPVTQSMPGQTGPTLQDLPAEILEKITHDLDPRPLAYLTRTNKYFEKITAYARAGHLLKQYENANVQHALRDAVIDMPWAINPLIRRGANIHRTNRFGYNHELTRAIYYNRKQVIAELLNNGVKASYLERFNILNIKYYYLPSLACIGIHSLAIGLIAKSPPQKTTLNTALSIMFIVCTTVAIEARFFISDPYYANRY